MKKFLLGASTAAHQVEGNNIHSDYWAQENMKVSPFFEPSGIAVDHYNRYREDINFLVNAGLNAYRFSIEWSRIEPDNGVFDEKEIQHYREMLNYCIEKEIQPIVTLHHFSSPVWVIREGGWESRKVVDYFTRYAAYVTFHLGELMEYVCTINEANMGLEIAKKVAEMMGTSVSTLQIGLNLQEIAQKNGNNENQAIFGTSHPQTFLSPRSFEGNEIILATHEAARKAIKEQCPHIKVGLTLSLHDFQAVDGGEKFAEEEWNSEFKTYLPAIQKDDFFGVQNYTRKVYDSNGLIALTEATRKTQSGYEFYPQSLGNVIRKVSEYLDIPLLVTENGVATDDDKERVEFIHEALQGVSSCLNSGINLLGYLHWSLLDNFEWQKGFAFRFGLIEVDRNTQVRSTKPSLAILGNYAKIWNE